MSTDPVSHKGWHSRGYLPHFDSAEIIQGVTFRLCDSVPAHLLDRWRDQLDVTPGDPESIRIRLKHQRLIRKYEDSGHGACWLREPRVAAMMQASLLHFDGSHYHLLEWCIMPNHVHVLIEPLLGHPLNTIVRSWKTWTARKGNQLLGRTGKFWANDYFDRYIRNDAQLRQARHYIRQNPVSAKLCESEFDWPYSSAYQSRES